MLPFERLRALAQYRSDDVELVIEAADCLGDFAVDPSHLVTVCRRLVSHHPTSAPLWWLCARVLAASDAGAAAHLAADLLASDLTASQMARRLPFPHDDVIAALGWSPTVTTAFLDRPDLDLVAVLDPTGNGHLRTPRQWDHSVQVVAGDNLAALGPSHALVPVIAASATTALVATGVPALLDSVPEAQVWLVAPVGHLLPERLFRALHANLEAHPEHAVAFEQLETMPIARATLIVTSDGLDAPMQLAARVDCPVAPELLRL